MRCSMNAIREDGVLLFGKSYLSNNIDLRSSKLGLHPVVPS